MVQEYNKGMNLLRSLIETIADMVRELLWGFGAEPVPVKVRSKPRRRRR